MILTEKGLIEIIRLLIEKGLEKNLENIAPSQVKDIVNTFNEESKRVDEMVSVGADDSNLMNGIKRDNERVDRDSNILP